MSSGPTASNSNQTFSLQPLDELSHKTKYKIRLDTRAKDLAGNPLSSDDTSEKGFTTFIGFTSHIITTYDNNSSSSADHPSSVYAIDLDGDGDGDMDILSGAYGDNKIAWYENKLK